MSITDMLIPPWAGGIFLGPLGHLIVEVYKHFSNSSHKLFGTGEQPNTPAAPPPDGPAPPGGGSGPTRDEIDRLNREIAQLQQQLQQLHSAGSNATDQSGNNSDDGRRRNDQILTDERALADGLWPQGSTPEAESGRLAAMQQQIDELTRNVQDKANTANGIADGLRNLGMGLPGAGMPGLGGPGLGGPSLGGGMPSVGPLGGGLGAPPTVASHRNKDMKPPTVSSTDNDPLTPPRVSTPGTPNQPGPSNTAPGGAPTTSTQPAANPGPPVPAHPGGPPPSPPAANPDSKDITLPSGQVVTAPNPAAAKAVRNALNQPAGKGDVATTAYAGTGVTIPTDGADPGRKIDPTDLQPGDIAIFDDHTAIVAGNGQLIGPDGKLQPLGVINDAPGFKGFFRPTESIDTPTPPTAPPPGPSPAPAGTILASPLPPRTGTNTKPTPPGFNLPAQPQAQSQHVN